MGKHGEGDRHGGGDRAFVETVLCMFDEIEDFKAAHPDDPICEDPSSASFAGFDMSTEASLYDLARASIQTGHPKQRRHEQATDGFNSHGRMRVIYEHMVDRWNETPTGCALTREDVLAILRA